MFFTVNREPLLPHDCNYHCMIYPKNSVKIKQRASKPVKTKTLLLLFFFVFPKLYAQNTTFDSLANEVNRVSIFNKTKSLKLLNELYQAARHSPDSALLTAHCLYEESSLNYRQGIVDTLLTIRIKNRLDRKQSASLEQALLQSALGTNLMSEKGYADAFPLHFQALEAFKLLKNDCFTARILNSLGNICYYFELFNLAENYYTEAIAYTSPKYFDYYYIKTNIFRVQSLRGCKNAIDSLCALPEIVIREDFEELLPVLYLNIGASLFQIDSERAFSYLSEMQSLEYENPKWLAVLHSFIGSYYFEKKDYHNALRYYFDALKVMEENHDFYNLTSIYNNISSIYEKQHQHEKALFYSRKSQDLMARLRSDLVAIETYRKYVDAFLEYSKNELIIAEQTIELKDKQFIIIAFVSVSSLLLILLILLCTHKQKQLKTSENRELTAKLEHEKKVQQYEKRQRKLEKEKQKELIDSKMRELTSYSMLVSNKNVILKQIMDLTTQMLDDKTTTGKTGKKINEIIQNNLDIDEEWENFKMHFDKVHPHFFEKLRQICPGLTEENLRMCAYIKIRLSTKHIAQLLHVIPSSIITGRYRLRKKLQLPDHKDLDDFIADL